MVPPGFRICGWLYTRAAEHSTKIRRGPDEPRAYNPPHAALSAVHASSVVAAMAAGRRDRPVASRAAGPGFTGHHRAGSARRAEEPGALAHVLGRLHRPAPQPADADDAAERRRARAAVDVPDRRPGFPGRGFEATPLVVDGVLYVTGQQQPGLGDRRADGPADLALSTHAAANFTASVCCGPVNRGFAVLGDRLLHGHARRAPRGARPQDRQRRLGRRGRRLRRRPTPITAAPLVVKDKVIVGVAGGDFASRGFIDAYDAQTGKRAWRFYTIPGAGEPGSESWPNAEAACARRRRARG